MLLGLEHFGDIYPRVFRNGFCPTDELLGRPFRDITMGEGQMFFYRWCSDKELLPAHATNALVVVVNLYGMA